MKKILMQVELHCHTNHSDGVPSVRELIEKAQKELGAVAITDHNTFSGYNEAKKMKLKCLLVPGIEVTCKHPKGHAHVGVLGVEELSVKAHCSLDELIDDAHSRDGVVVNVHPFGGFSRNGFNDVKNAKKFDVIEVLNGNTLPSGNKKAYELAQKLNMPMTCGSDAHRLEDVGKFACEIDANSIDGILKCIKKGQVKIPNKQTSTISLLSAKMKRRIKRKLKSMGG